MSAFQEIILGAGLLAAAAAILGLFLKVRQVESLLREHLRGEKPPPDAPAP